MFLETASSGDLKKKKKKNNSKKTHRWEVLLLAEL